MDIGAVSILAITNGAALNICLSPCGNMVFSFFLRKLLGGEWLDQMAGICLIF